MVMAADACRDVSSGVSAAIDDLLALDPRTLPDASLHELIRDRHCQHASGCDEPLDRCEVDHIHEYEDGGPTTQANGELECRYHNRWKHNHKHPPNRPPPEAA